MFKYLFLRQDMAAARQGGDKLATEIIRSSKSP